MNTFTDCSLEYNYKTLRKHFSREIVASISVVCWLPDFSGSMNPLINWLPAWKLWKYPEISLRIPLLLEDFVEFEGGYPYFISFVLVFLNKYSDYPNILTTQKFSGYKRFQNFIVILMKRFVLRHFKLQLLILNVWRLPWLHEVSKLIWELSDNVYSSRSVIETILNWNRTF